MFDTNSGGTPRDLGLIVSVAASVLASMLLTVDDSTLPGGALLKVSAIGLMLGVVLGWLVLAQGAARARPLAAALFAGAAAFVASRTLFAMPPNTPGFIIAANLVVAAAVLVLPVSLALRWDEQGRHRARGGRPAAV